jgi:hypothetical protein
MLALPAAAASYLLRLGALDIALLLEQVGPHGAHTVRTIKLPGDGELADELHSRVTAPDHRESDGPRRTRR